jgi:uncharacterized protein (TIGR02246 family)
MKAFALATPLLMLAAVAQARDFRSEIDAADARWLAAFNKGDPAAIAQLYTEQATALPPGMEMAKGRAAIQALWQGAIKDGVKNVTLKTLPVDQFGNAAREIGQYGLDAPVAPHRRKLEARHRHLEQQPLKEDIAHAAPAGSMITNRVPPFAAADTVSRPPCASTSSRQIERPNPSPAAFDVTKG